MRTRCNGIHPVVHRLLRRYKTLEALARAMDVSYSTAMAWKRGAQPQPLTIQKMEDLLSEKQP